MKSTSFFPLYTVPSTNCLKWGTDTCQTKILVPYEASCCHIAIVSACLREGGSPNTGDQPGTAGWTINTPVQLVSNPSFSKNDIAMWYRNFYRKSAKYMLTMHRDKGQLLHRLLLHRRNALPWTFVCTPSMSWKQRGKIQNPLFQPIKLCSIGDPLIQCLLWTSLHWPQILHISSLLPKLLCSLLHTHTSRETSQQTPECPVYQVTL